MNQPGMIDRELGVTLLAPPNRPLKMWTAGLLAGLSMTAATGFIAVPDHSIQSLSESTTPPLSRLHQPIGTSTSPTKRREISKTATLVKDIHHTSGLTWEQFGRMMGVSRRAVHLWASGGRINARHLEDLTALRLILDRLQAESPVHRRLQLFEHRGSAPSIFDEFIRRHSSERNVVAGDSLPLEQLFDVRHDTESD